MNITVIGTGYVGLVAGVCFADSGHSVICVDRDETKLALLKNGQPPIYEPSLDDILARASARLTFTSDIRKGIQESQLIFIAVGTPETADGSADLRPTTEVVQQICDHANDKKFVVLKSTVPIGTARNMKALCQSKCKYPVEFISNPEFLREGAAVDDFLNPDRVIIGCESEQARSLMKEVYEPFLDANQSPILFMDNTSAEMTKYAANAFLSVKISFINELALLADNLGADIEKVRTGFTSDHRINPAFFHPGLGYGGSCFPKDVKALVHTGQANGVKMQVVKSADEVNQRQREILFQRILNRFGDLKGRKIAMWGLSFKPMTDDVREAPALYLISKLTEHGAEVIAYDPVAGENAQKMSATKFRLAPAALAATEGADALVVVTEWNEFHNPDFKKLKGQLKNAIVFDGRNVYSPEKMRDLGFEYYCIGRQGLAKETRIE